MEPINIAIVDDHDLFREGICLVLGQIENFEVVFNTSNGNLFLEFLQSCIPDVVLMDINMPIIDGIETTRKALEICPALKVIALTMFSDTSHYTQMIHAGIKGFILKKSNKFELQQSINTVYGGGNYFSQEILQKMAFQSLNFQDHADKFTLRELEVLHLVCKGQTSQEISDKLFISVKTVETHRNNIFQKARVRNSSELIVWALKNNYFSI
ncbi:MAG: response regulator transcription factor [Bacteroidota bacterium]